MLTDLLHYRIRAAAAKKSNPTKPTVLFTSSLATLTAITRETSYLQITPIATSAWIRLPPLGSIILILSYFGFIIALEFTNNNYPGAQHDQALGIRAAWLAVAQVPLLILLSGKVNIIGLLTGTSYERLNVYHRWVARGLLMLASMHFGFQSRGWSKYGLMQLEWDTDTCPPTGIAAYAILLWMNLSTLAPLRKISYKFFVVQHVITFMGLIIALMEHLPTTALYSRVYIWIPIGLYFFDRTIRTGLYLRNNMSPAKATLEPLEGPAVKLRLSNVNLKNWTPGAHVRLMFPKFGFWHTHPARILSSPSSHNGDLVFIFRARGWLTQMLFERAEASSLKKRSDGGSSPTYTALFGGPYSSSHSDFAAFQTLILIAGGSGITFTLSALLDLAHRANQQKLPLQAINFVWVIRSASWISWINDELQAAVSELHKAGIETNIQIFITRDANLGEMTQTFEKGTINIGTKTANHNCSSSEGGEATADTLCSDDLPLPAKYNAGRPDPYTLLDPPIERAKGETAIGVCGPLGLVTAIRNAVVNISDDRAVHKGTGAQGIYLHVANTDYS